MPKIKSLVAAAEPDEPLMTVSIYVCTEETLIATRKAQEALLREYIPGPLKFAYFVVEDKELDDFDYDELAMILSEDITRQAGAGSAA